MKPSRKIGSPVTLKLTAPDRRSVTKLLKKGVLSVWTVKRIQILLHLDSGRGTPAVAEAVGATMATVRNIAHRYLDKGLVRAIYDAPRPGAVPILDARLQQNVIALVCSHPPPGRARWTVRLLAGELVERGIVDKIGRESVRVFLSRHELKPWREKNVVYR